MKIRTTLEGKVGCLRREWNDGKTVLKLKIETQNKNDWAYMPFSLRDEIVVTACERMLTESAGSYKQLLTGQKIRYALVMSDSEMRSYALDVLSGPLKGAKYRL